MITRLEFLKLDGALPLEAGVKGVHELVLAQEIERTVGALRQLGEGAEIKPDFNKNQQTTAINVRAKDGRVIRIAGTSAEKPGETRPFKDADAQRIVSLLTGADPGFLAENWPALVLAGTGAALLGKVATGTALGRNLQAANEADSRKRFVTGTLPYLVLTGAGLTALALSPSSQAQAKEDFKQLPPQVQAPLAAISITETDRITASPTPVPTAFGTATATRTPEGRITIAPTPTLTPTSRPTEIPTTPSPTPTATAIEVIVSPTPKPKPTEAQAVEPPKFKEPMLVALSEDGETEVRMGTDAKVPGSPVIWDRVHHPNAENDITDWWREVMDDQPEPEGHPGTFAVLMQVGGKIIPQTVFIPKGRPLEIVWGVKQPGERYLIDSDNNAAFILGINEFGGLRGTILLTQEAWNLIRPNLLAAYIRGLWGIIRFPAEQQQAQTADPKWLRQIPKESKVFSWKTPYNASYGIVSR